MRCQTVIANLIGLGKSVVER